MMFLTAVILQTNLDTLNSDQRRSKGKALVDLVVRFVGWRARC